MILNVDYNRRIWTGLSGDDWGDVPIQEGDVVYLMDVNQCWVFGELQAYQLPDLGGGGGGGSGYTLQLYAQGSYTRTTSAGTMTIPISIGDSDAVKEACVVVDIPLNSTNQGLYALRYYHSNFDAAEFVSSPSAVRVRKSDNTETYVQSYPNAISITTSEISLAVQNTTYNWKANTYTWKLYKEVVLS